MALYLTSHDHKLLVLLLGHVGPIFIFTFMVGVGVSFIVLGGNCLQLILDWIIHNIAELQYFRLEFIEVPGNSPLLGEECLTYSV